MGTLRTLLALSVLIAHGSLTVVFVGAQHAVQLFYLISGFLISFVLTNTRSYEHAGLFWANRALRLYPIYFVVAALTLAARYINPGPFANFSQVSLLGQIYLAVVNITILGQDWLMFIGLHEGHLEFTGHWWDSELVLWNMLLIPQSWTLGIELSFYAIAPFIVRRPLVLLALFVASATSRGIAIHEGFGFEDPWTYRFFPFELALFILGVGSHQLLLKPMTGLISLLGRFPLERAVFGICVALCVSYSLVPLSESVKLPVLFALIFFSLPFLFIFQDKSSIDQWIGDLSYPLYICHWLVIMIINYLTPKLAYFPPVGGLGDCLIKVIGSLAFSVILKILIADPVEVLRKKFRNGRKALYITDVPQPAGTV